jgi:hypothetical protein
MTAPSGAEVEIKRLERGDAAATCELCRLTPKEAVDEIIRRAASEQGAGLCERCLNRLIKYVHGRLARRSVQ